MRELPKFSRQQAVWYLSAIIDGEGSLFLSSNRRDGIRSLAVTNTDMGIIQAICDCYDVLGVTYRVFEKSNRTNKLGKKPITQVSVGRKENFLILGRCLRLQSEEKASKLRQIVESYYAGIAA